MRDPRHDILFEPIQIGPFRAKNRFYQVPHCSGMGWKRPQSLAAMRGMKAEGGWGVVNTEYCSVHPTSDNEYFANATLWTEDDVRANAAMTEAVHAHGALAGVELWLGGGMIMNLSTRLPALGLRNRPQTDSGVYNPGQTRKVDKQDIRNLRQWHRDAAKRAVNAGFDIVYVYATHGYMLSEFLDASINNRTDEYGGSLENRMRIVRELIEETREAVQGKAAVATRFSVDLDHAETYDMFGLLAELPDLWDLTVPDYGVEMGASRFVKEGALAPSVAAAKQLTTKPVVAVSRYTSPDTMASVIRSGGQDMIGAARPSIADPFLPKKIEEGRSEDIRECIGCNICYAHDSLGVPIRCTQNPTMGEEWRMGWHPERVAAAETKERVLVVGGGPTGLEAARVLGEAGHSVMLAEANRTFGGRVSAEARLPGLSEWARVRDWRLGQLEKLETVQLFPESPMSASDILTLDVDHVLFATGSAWASDTIGRHSVTGLSEQAPGMLLGAETVLRGEEIDANHVLIYDDDHYYMGSVIALALRKAGHRVTLVTSAGRPCEFGVYTGEIYESNARLFEAGIEVITNKMVTALEAGFAVAECTMSGRIERLSCDVMIPICRRLPNQREHDDFARLYESGQAAAVKSFARIGDADAPNTIAAAVYAGYRAGVELGKTLDLAQVFGRREHPAVS